MRTAFGEPQFVWLRRLDKVRQGISWWRASVTGQWGLRPDQLADSLTDRYVDLVRAATGGRCGPR